MLGLLRLLDGLATQLYQAQDRIKELEAELTAAKSSEPRA